MFRSLGDPARLAILGRLAVGEARVTDLTGELGLAQSTVSKHLACLRDCSLVMVRAAMRASVYSLAQPAGAATTARKAIDALDEGGLIKRLNGPLKVQACAEPLEPRIAAERVNAEGAGRRASR